MEKNIIFYKKMKLVIAKLYKKLLPCV